MPRLSRQERELSKRLDTLGQKVLTGKATLEETWELVETSTQLLNFEASSHARVVVARPVATIRSRK